MLKITDTLIVEYVDLPIHNLDQNVLMRFVEPFPTVWVEKSYAMIQRMIDPLYLETFFMSKYKDYLSKEGPLPQELQWLENINKIKIVECHIVPKNV